MDKNKNLPFELYWNPDFSDLNRPIDVGPAKAEEEIKISMENVPENKQNILERIGKLLRDFTNGVNESKSTTKIGPLVMVRNKGTKVVEDGGEIQ